MIATKSDSNISDSNQPCGLSNCGRYPNPQPGETEPLPISPGFLHQQDSVFRWARKVGRDANFQVS